MDVNAATLPGSRAGRREWLGLVLLILPALLIAIDQTNLYLALPRLTAALQPSAVQQLWILDIYGFMVAGFLITMGTLGDRIGRKKLLLIGTAAFGLSSLLAAYSTSPEMLIAARTLLGIAGATVAPSTLALIRSIFTDPKQRGVAVSVWMASWLGGAVFGPIVGGTLLTHFWWGSVFLIGAPVMLVVQIAGPVLLPEHRDPGAGRLDLLSILLSLAAVFPFIYGVTELARNGWRPSYGIAMAIGIAAGVVFLVRQRVLDDPLVDLGLFNNRTYRSSFVLGLLGGALQGGTLLLVNLYLQAVDGYTPLRAGLWLIPTAATMVFTIMVSTGLARQIRPAYIMAAGLVLSAGGYLLLTQVASTGGLLLVVMGWGIATAGIGPATALGYDMIIGSMPPEKAGIASALVETGGQAGVSAGIAFLGSIATAVYRGMITVPAGLPAKAAAGARDSITGALSVAQGLPGTVRALLLRSAHHAFTAGLHIATFIGAVIFIGLAMLAVRTLRHVPPSSQAEPVGAGPGAHEEVVAAPATAAVDSAS